MSRSGLYFSSSLILVALLSACSSCPHPSDADLREYFQGHKSKFNELARMAAGDSCIVRIDFDWTSPDEAGLARCGVTAERLGEYRKLLRSVGAVKGLFRRENRGEIGFIMSTTGVMVTGSGSSKSIVLRKQPIEAASKETCTCEFNMAEQSESFRLIEGNWYISFEC